MKQGRTPDRVHVVRPPQDDYRSDMAGGALQAAPAQNPRAMEIIRTLAAISDKLKRSEAERYELLAELREYRKSLHAIEDKIEKTEKTQTALESRIKSHDSIESEISQRQARFERVLKDAEGKLVQAVAGQSLLDQRLADNEAFRAAITQRLDESITQQARLDRQIEKIAQDKGRMLRKVERMEEILSETQDTLKARALVLLSERSAAAQGLPQISAYSESGTADVDGTQMPWWRKPARLQNIGMVSMVTAAALLGWTINQAQQPDIPKIAVLENGQLARMNADESRWEIFKPDALATASPAQQAQIAPAMPPVTKPEEDTAATDGAVSEPSPAMAIQASVSNLEDSAPLEQTPAAQAALNASDEQLLAALEENPEGLAAQLNEIAPEVSRELELPTPAPLHAGAYDPLTPLAAKAYAQDPQVANTIAKEKGNGVISVRMAPDNALPVSIAQLQDQAYLGVAEAQHDLAAIYTAGRGGVTQDFEKAAFWFREAADNDVANAAYNLGVLYHQGLGVEKDLDRAIYWYRDAAKLGHAEARYNLGIASIEGIGTSYDAPLAAAFFESAANAGVTEAAYNLGLIYENGLVGGATRGEDAMLWYKIAADGGNADAKAALQQLSSSLQIGMLDIDKIIEKMQENYQTAHGRRAGGNATKS